jgi:hypothetical protein
MRLALGLLLALVAVIATLGVGNAADWEIVPSVTARTEFETNLNYTFTHPTSDYVFSLAPTATFNYYTDTAQLQGILGLTGWHYLSNGQIDHIDQNFQVNGWYQVTPRWKLGLNTAYINDSSLREELLVSGLVMTRTPRISILAGPAVTYALTERLAVIANYNYYQVNYTSPLYPNYNTQQAGLRLEQLLKNEKTTLIGNFNASETAYPGQNSVYKALGFYLGADHKFSPEWEIGLLGGVNLNFLDFPTQVLNPAQFPFVTSFQQVRVHQTSAEPFINLSVTRSWTNFSMAGGYSRNQSPSAYGTISDYNQFFLNLNYNFTDKWSGSLSGFYTLNDQISTRTSYQSSFLTINPQLRYNLTEKLTLSPGYSFGQRDEITPHSLTANNQMVWLMLNYTQPSVLAEARAPTPVGTMPTMPASARTAPPTPILFGR